MKTAEELYQDASLAFKGGDLEKAIKHYKQAIKLNPSFARAWGNLAAIYALQYKLPQAEKALKKAIRLNPSLPHLFFNMGMILEEQDKIKEAIANLRTALRLNPNFLPAIEALFFCKREACDWQNLSQLEKTMDEKKCDSHFTSILRCDDPAQNLQAARGCSRNLTQLSREQSFTHPPGQRGKTTKIRIGYLSNDFRDHPVGQIVTPIFAHHDKNKFEIYIFSSGKDDNSVWRKMAENAGNFFDISGKDPLQAAKLINNLKIDILVDTTGPMSHRPMLIPAFRPAPIQISWMGILGTTGTDFFDYIIGDNIVTPKSHDNFYSEKIIRLPCFTWIEKKAETDARFNRKNFNLPENAFVLAYFSLPLKIDPFTWKVWMSILKEIPHGVLWLWKRNSQVVINLQREAGRLGVDPHRLIFFEKIPFEQHLARMSLADLALDTFIYQGALTSTSTLSAGLPLLTVLGNHFISRVSASILTRLGLTQLIATSAEEYKDKAVFLAQNPNSLQLLKSGVSKSLIQNKYSIRTFVGDLEEVFTALWRKYPGTIK